MSITNIKEFPENAGVQFVLKKKFKDNEPGTILEFKKSAYVQGMDMAMVQPEGGRAFAIDPDYLQLPGGEVAQAAEPEGDEAAGPQPGQSVSVADLIGALSQGGGSNVGAQPATAA